MSPTNLDTQYSNTVAGWMAAADTRAQGAGEPAWALEKRRRAAQTAASKLEVFRGALIRPSPPSGAG